MITLILFIFIIVLWASLSVWRERSIRKEHYLLDTHRVYLFHKNRNDIEQLKQFEENKAVFDKYFIELGSDYQSYTDSEGMKVFKSAFTKFKRDKGMQFAQFPALYFHLIFAVLSSILFYINTFF